MVCVIAFDITEQRVSELVKDRVRGIHRDTVTASEWQRDNPCDDGRDQPHPRSIVPELNETSQEFVGGSHQDRTDPNDRELGTYLNNPELLLDTFSSKSSSKRGTRGLAH